MLKTARPVLAQARSKPAEARSDGIQLNTM